MKTIKELISKLESLTFVEVENKKLISKEGYEVSYRTKFLTSPPHAEDYPVQIVIQVFKNNSHVMTWGCEDNESNRLFVNFYQVAKSRAYDKEISIADDLQDKYKQEFLNL